MQQFLRVMTVIVIFGPMAGCQSYHPQPLNRYRELDSLRTRDLTQFVVKQAEQSNPASTQPSKHFDLGDGLNEIETVAVALTLNPELKAKRAATGEAQAALISAGQWPNPEVSVGLRPGIDGASGYAVEGDALFQLLFPWERDARKKAANARVEEVRAESVADELRLVGEVRQQRLGVLAAYKAVALLEEAVQLRERGSDLVRRQRQLGEANELEIAATELELAEARRDLRQARVEFSTQMQQLNRLLGLPTVYPLHLSDLNEPLKIAVLEDVGDEELDRRLLAGRPELRAKEASYARAEQELRLAVQGQYPRVGIGPSFERELEGDKSLGLGVSVQVPLLNQNQGEIAERRAARERSRAEYTALLHTLRANAFEARAAVQNAKAEVDAQERDILPLLQRSSELSEGAFRAREVSIINWITTQQRAVNARREYLDALVRYRRAVIRLETAAGQTGAEAATVLPTTQSN